MKWLKRFLLAGGSLLAMTAHAHADPISIGFLLFAGPLGSAFSFAALVTAAQIGIYAVGIGVSLLAGQMGRQKIDPGQYKNTFDTAESSEVNAIGRVALGGLKIFGNTAGEDRYRLIGHVKGPLVAIEEFRLGGREVTVDPDGSVSSPPYAKPDGSYVTWLTKDGTGAETSWSQLQSAFSNLWTADHRVRGIAQSLVKYVSPGIYTETFGKLYQGGEPAPTIVARVNTAYDPRDGTQNRNDPATWKWTDNGPLCAARIMLAYPELTVDSFDWTFIASEADRADALVATKTGTEPRSRCSGVWLSESERGSTMQQVLDSIGAEIVQSDAGLIRIRLIDDAATSEVSFTDRDLIDWSWRSGPEAVERPNICRIKFYSAERNYEMADLDMTGIVWARIDDEVARYGEKPLDIELPFCPSASQAQRIARRMFALARADAGAINTNMVGLMAWGMTYAAIELSDLGETPVCKIAAPRIDDEAGKVEIPFAVWPSLPAWNPATDEADAPEPVPDLQYESDLDKPAVPTYAQVQYPGGGYELRIAFLQVPDGITAEATYRTYAAGVPELWTGMTEYVSEVAPNQFYGHVPVNADGKDADFRVRFFNAELEASYWSDMREVRPVAIGNAAPSLRNDDITGNYGEYSNISTTSLNAAYATLRIRQYADGAYGPYTTVDTSNIRPGEAVTLTDPNPPVPPSLFERVEYSVRVHTTNGTASAPFIEEFIGE